MSLVENMMEDFILMEYTRSSDGEGGASSTWKEGLTFKAAVVQDTTMQARLAQQQGVTSVYTVTTKKNMKLLYHDVFKSKDGKLYRVTSEPGEKMAPAVSTLNMSQVLAEKIRALPV